MTDYAEELLGGPAKAPAAAKFDYAEILSAPTDAPSMATSDTYTGNAPGAIAAPVSRKGVGFLAGLKMNIPSDPETKRRIVAKALFPDDPKGIERVGSKGGKVVFVNDKGELENADAGTLTTLGGWLANLPELVGSVAGSFTPAGPVSGAAVGGMAGKGWKQVLSNLLLDEPQTAGGNAADLAQEGAINAVGGGLVKGGAAIYNRSAVRNAERFDQGAADALIDRIHRSTGIRLDYAQAGNLPQLRNLKKWAAKHPSEAQELIETMDREQADQVATAIESKILGALSRESDPAALASSGVNAAKAAIEAAKVKRSAVAQPLYEKAYQDAVDPATLKEILKADPLIARSMRSVLNDPKYKRDLAGADKHSIRTLDLVKRDLDTLIGEAKGKPGGGNDARILTRAKEDLLTFLDAHSPAYQVARAEYGKLSKSLVEPLENGTIGILAKIEGPKMAQTVAQVVDDLTSNPAAVTLVKNQLRNTQGAQAWNDVLKLSLARKFDKAAKETQAGDVLNVAGKFRQAVIGTPQQKQAMTNALGGSGVQAFDDVMDALQLIAKDLRNRPASDTAAFQALEKQQAEKAMGLLQTAGVKLAKGINPMEWAQALEKMGQNRFLQDNAVKIAQSLQDPAKIKRLAELRKAKSSTERALAVVTLFGLGVPTEETIDRNLAPGPDAAPRVPQPQQ